jgi:hypothetical protein
MQVNSVDQAVLPAANIGRVDHRSQGVERRSLGPSRSGFRAVTSYLDRLIVHRPPRG